MPLSQIRARSELIVGRDQNPEPASHRSRPLSAKALGHLHKAAVTMEPSQELEAIGKILKSAKRLAKRYYKLTGRPLGITGEVAEYEAVRLLGLERSPVRQAGYDAVRRERRRGGRLQIKARCILNPSRPGQRLGQIRLDRQWDRVLLVLLDRDLEPVEIHEAGRTAITKALLRPGSKSRNNRGALALNQFKRIARRVWSSEDNVPPS